MSALAQKATNRTLKTTPWIDAMAYWLSATDKQIDLSLRTTLSCALSGDKPSMFLPPEMATLQPDNLRYLHRMASRFNCRLVEDRRSIDIKPLIEQRVESISPMMQASIELLQQTGLKSKKMKPSHPNLLNDEGIHVPLTELIDLAVRVVEEGKRVVVLPNPSIVDLLGGDTNPIVGYAANVHASDDVVTVAVFDSAKYRSVGYRSGNQYINHVLLGGGPAHKPELWAAEATLVEAQTRFQLYRSQKPQFDMGLMSVTQYIDI